MSVNDKEKLRVFYNATDLTEQAFDFSRDSFTIAAFITTDFIYLGRDKPFHAVFVDMGATVNAVTSAMTIEYGDDEDTPTSFTALDVTVQDTTQTGRAFARSGFIKWVIPVDGNNNGLWKKTTINSVEKFWARISISVNLTASIIFNGINILFADDNDLKKEDFGILNYLPEDETKTAATSHILSHMAARDWILQKMRNDGKGVNNADRTGTVKFLDGWDLLDIQEIRQAAIFKALEKIYHQQSTNPDDIWKVQEKEAQEDATAQFNLWFFSLDADDDGIPDSNEISADDSGIMSRR